MFVERWRDTSLGTRLILSSTLLIATLVSTVLLALSLEMRGNTRDLLVEALGRSQRMLVARERADLRHLLWASSMITRNPTLLAAIETYRVESPGGASRGDLLATIDNEIAKIAAGLDKDVILVTDEQGIVLASRSSAGPRPEPGSDLSAALPGRAATDGDDPGFSVLHLEGEPFLAGSVPIELQGFVIGMLTLGDRLDGEFLRALQEDAFGGQVVMTRDDRVLESTLPAVAAGDRFVPASRTPPAEDGSTLVPIGPEEYVIAVLPLGAAEDGRPVSVYLLHSLSQVLRPRHAALRRTILAHAAGAVLLGALMMWGLSRSALKRLKQLVAFMRSVAETGDYARRFEEGGAGAGPGTQGAEPGRRGRNELSLLTQTFDEMLAEIQARDQELRRQVRERRHAEKALHEKEGQLQQSQKIEALGRLAGGVAHDFNNLLTVISGYSEIVLAKLNETDPLRGKLHEIRKASGRAASLTQQLLAFSRKQVLEPKVLGLNEVVAGVEKMLERLIGEDLDLRTALRPDLDRVKADPGQIEQVLLNLSVNARDAMSGGGELTIETANVRVDAASPPFPGMGPGRYVRLSVRDTGCGMDEETRRRIFEPFFTTKGPGRGTGLGMAMVYGIVKQSGGWITVDSEPGRGTTIDVYLPSVEAPADPEAAALAGAAPRGSETLLLVEDEEQVRAFARLILEENGYRVLEARHGLEAVAVGRGHDGPIHLMVTDVVMPHLNGREAYDRLAQIRPSMRVLYTSGYTDRGIVQPGGTLDPSIAFLPKPFTPASLASKVREILDAAET
jgi:signal transduction histidine kinase/CheY-like chemotaxis protein